MGLSKEQLEAIRERLVELRDKHYWPQNQDDIDEITNDLGSLLSEVERLRKAYDEAINEIEERAEEMAEIVGCMMCRLCDKHW